MDLSALDIVTDAVFMQLKHPATRTPLIRDEDPAKPVGLMMMGKDSDTFKKRRREITDRRLQAKGQLKISAEDVDTEAQETLVACVTGLRNIVVEGEEVEYSPDAVRALFKRFPWIEEQADDWVMDRSNFIKPSQKT